MELKRAFQLNCESFGQNNQNEKANFLLGKQCRASKICVQLAEILLAKGHVEILVSFHALVVTSLHKLEAHARGPACHVIHLG